MSNFESNQVESNTLTGGTKATVSGNLPKDTVATLDEVNNVEATELAQKHVSKIVNDDVLFAFDLSLSSNNNEYQPEEHNQKVKVKLSNIELENNKNYAMLHIIDDKNFEILPITRLNNNQIEFEATRFSVYMVITVGSNDVTFEGEHYKIYDMSGNEIISSTQITDTSNFIFKVVPEEGYGIITVDCTDSLGATAVDGNGNKILTLSNIENGKQAVLSSITKDLNIEVTTYEKIVNSMEIAYYNSKVLLEPTLVLPETITVGLGEIKRIDLSYNGDGALSVQVKDIGHIAASISGTTLTIVGNVMGTTSVTVNAAKGSDYFAKSVTANVEVVETTKAIETEWTIPAGGATINLPIPSATTNMYRVDWGDGTVNSYTTEAFPSHQYNNAEVKTYTIKISGIVETFGFTKGANEQPTESVNKDYYSFTRYLTGLKEWGSVEATSYGFAWCTNLAGTIPLPNDDTFVSVASLENLFYGCNNLTGAIPAGLFNGATNVTTYRSAFNGCTGLTSVPARLFDGNTGITSNADATSGYAEVFMNCTGLTDVTVDSKYVGYRMFYGCNNLTDITITDDVEDIYDDSEGAFGATSPYSSSNLLYTNLTTSNSLASSYNWIGDNRVTKYNNKNVSFVGENFKVQDLNGKDLSIPLSVVLNKELEFRIIPKYGYGVTEITCTNSAGTVTIDVSGYIMNKLVKIPAVTEDLTITVTTVKAPEITVQPVSIKAKIGGTAKYTITAVNATSYQWQYRDVGNTYWTNASTSQTLSVTPAASMAGRQYRCLVGDANFTEHVRVPSDIVYIIPTDDEITETAIISNSTTTEILPPKITVQPVSIKATIGSTAKFTIKAENATTYQWQYRDSRDEYWTNSTKTSSTSGTATLSVTAAYSTSGREYRCLVGNANYPDHSRAKSDIFALIVADDEITEPVTVWDLEITKQPESQKVKFGDVATFTVETAGTNTYKWQYKTSNGDEEWIDVDANIGTSSAIASGFTTNTLTIDTSKMAINEENLEVTNNLSGYIFRCVVNSTIYTPASIASDAAYLSVAQDEYIIENIKTKTPATLNIVDNALVGTGDTTEIGFEYNGDGTLSASSNNEGIVIATVSNGKLVLTGVSEGSATVTLNAASGTTYGPATATINVQVLSVNKVTFIGGNFKVQDSNGNVLTSPVSAESGKAFNFVILPDDGYGITDVTCVNGAGEAPVDESGNPLFAVSGFVKGKAGIISVVSEDLTVNVTTALAPEITTQPLTEKVKVGNTATFTVAANNATTYTWQYRDGRDDYWKDVTSTMGTDYNTATYITSAIDYNWAGYEFRCLVGNDNFTGDERVTTDIVALSVASDDIVIGETPVILEQPNMDNAKVEVNTGKATFYVTALGKDLTFTWQYRENRDTYWKTMVSSVGSATTTTVSTDPGFPTAKSTLQTATAIYSMAGYEFRCLVGNEFYANDDAVKSDIVAISVADDDISQQVQVQDLGIAKQPESQKVAIGETATFTIEKTETSTINTYKWQYKESESGDFWLDVDANMGKDTTVAAGFNTATLTINTNCMSINEETLEVTNNLSGYLFRCVVSNSSLPTVTKNSDTAILSVAQDDIIIDNIQIMKEPTIEVPANIIVGVGETKTYEIAYNGDGTITCSPADGFVTTSVENNVLTIVGVAEGVTSITLEASKGIEYAAKTVTIDVEVEDTKKAFITEWTIPVDADGTLATEGVAKTTIKLPIPKATTNAYTVDWGDGTTNTYDGTADFPTHTYTNTVETVYTIKIKGKVDGYGNYYISGVSGTNYNTFKQYVTGLIQWGELEATRYSFSDCKNLNSAIPSPTENSFVNLSSCENLFANCSKLYGSIPSDLFKNATKVTDFSSTFGSSGITGNIPENLFENTPNVTDFSGTFNSCNGLTGSIPEKLFINTPNVTSFNATFRGCKGLTGSIPAGLFAKTTDVTTFSEVFRACSGLTGSIPANLFKGLEKVQSFSSAFYDCSGLTGSIPGELFKTNIAVTTFSYTFGNCSGLTGSIPGELFANTKDVTDFSNTFHSCWRITSIPSELFANTKNVKSFSHVFYSCRGLTNIPSELFANTPNVISYHSAFGNCIKLTSVPKGLFANNQGITSTSVLDSVFSYCSGLTSAVVDSKYVGDRMFMSCNNLTDITITENVQEIGDYAFKATSPYSSTNLLPTKLTTTNPVALSYDWAADNRGVDTVAPTVTFTPNGNTTWATSQSITIALEDGSGLDNTSLRYMWTQSTTAPTEENFMANGTSFANGETITKDGVSGNDWYLWIIAKDTRGNTTITNTNAFYLDNEKPEITISASEVKFGENINITLGDTLSGVTGWQVTASDTEPTTWNEITATESTTVTYTTDRAGKHYVWTKDSAGNISLATEFTVSGQDLSGATVTLNPETFTYDGDAKEPEVTVVFNENTLTKDEDYTVRYENNTEVGTATVIIEGINNYTGTVIATFTIEKEIYDDILVDTTAPIISNIVGTREDIITITATITDPSITDDITSEVIPGVGVNEAATRYALTLTDEKPAADSDVWQESNEFAIPKAKMAYMWVKAEDNVGNIAIEGSSIIVSVSINTLDIKTSPSSFVYDGTEKTLTVVIKEDDYTLVEGTDYELSYEENKNVGTATLTITGLDMYSDTKVINFAITQRDLIVTPNINQNIIFGAAEPKLTYTYTGNVDGEEPGFEGDLSRAEGTDVGTYAITLGTLELKDNGDFLKDNYNLIFNGSGITFEIKQKSLSGATVVLNENEFTYDGAEKKPTPTVVVDGKPLSPGKDYTVSYNNNTNVGSADDTTVANRPTVIITGAGNYEGTAYAYFTINPATLSVTLGDYTSEYDGLAHGITVTAPADSVVTYSKDGVTYSETAPTYTDVSVNTVYVKVEKANYNTYTDSAVVTINPKAVTVDWPDNLTLDYIGAEQVPSVPTIEGVNGEVITLTVDGAKSAVGGPYTAIASIASVSGANGKASNYALTNPTATFYISNDKISISAKLDSNSFVYDGSAKTPAVTVTTIIDGETVTLVEGKDFDVAHDETKDVGTKTVTITGKGDYAGKGTSVTFEITKKDLVVTPKDNQSMIYGDTEPKLEYTFSGNVSGETPEFSGALSREEGENKGTYEITQGTLALQDKENFLANNYNLVFNGNGVTFEITQRDISSMQISLDKATFEYDGTYHTPNAVIVLNGKNLIKDTDFEITYVANKHVGQATATVKGIGNFTGSKTVNFTITAKALTVNWTNTTLEYVNGLSQAPTASATTGVDGENITLAVTGAKENVGTGYIAELDLANSSITGTDSKLTNYTFNPTSTTFNIVLPDGSGFVITYVDAVANGVYTYNGLEIEPEVKVTTEAGVELTAGTDYTVDYTNNIDAGTADKKPTVVVTGINNYAGVNATKVFTINKKAVDVVWTGNSFIYLGTAQKPTVGDITGVNGEVIKLAVSGEKTEIGTGYIATATIDKVENGRATKENYTLSNPTFEFEIYMGNYSDGTRHYLTLADAFYGAVTGSTITVLKDVEDSYAILTKGKVITLNTSDKTITMVSKGPEDKYEVGILNYGDLTIEGNGTITTLDRADNGIMFLIQNYNKLTINGSTLVNKGNNVINYDESGNYRSFYIIFSKYKEKTYVNINGGTLSVEGSLEKDLGRAISLYGTTFNMTNGEINAKGPKGIGIFVWENEETAQYPVTAGEITISGGQIISANAGIYYGSYAGPIDVKTTITGGTIIAEGHGIDNSASSGDILIYGGSIISERSAISNIGTGKVIIGNKDTELSTTSPVIQSDTNAIYSTNGFEFYSGILKGTEEKVFTANVTEMREGYGIKYGKEGTYNTAILAPLEKASAPTITGTVATNTWSQGAVTVTITANATEPVGGQTLQYKVNDGEWTNYVEALTINTEGITTIVARAVNTIEPEDTSLMSAEVTYVVKVDSEKPTVETSDITYGEKANITLKDATSGVVGYIVSENNTVPTATSEWTEIEVSTNKVVEYTPSKATTYYVWAIDDAGNISAQATIDVSAKDISTLDIALDKATFEYDGTYHTPNAVIVLNGENLIKDTDFEITYVDNKHVGRATATVKGIGNFTGSKTVNFTITAKALIVNWTNTTLEYVNGLSQAPTASATTGVDGENITLAVTGAKENVGTGYIAELDLANSSITGTDSKLTNYTFNPTSTTFSIVLPEGSGFVINFTDTTANGVYTYNGAEIRPEVKVTTESGATLTAGEDYTVSYTNNIDAGTESNKPTITVTGINNYAGVNANKEFTINKKSVAVVWGDTELEYVKGLSQAPTATAEAGVTGETINLVITGAQINVGTGYTATIDLTATKVNGGRAKLDNYTLSPVTTTFDIVLPEGSDFVINFTDTTANGVYTYNGAEIKPEVKVTTESGITLTAGTDYTVSYINNIDAGTESSKPTITVTGINNYAGVNATKEFTINKKSVNVVWTNTSLEFNNKAQKPTANVTTGIANETINLVITGAKVNVGTGYTATIDLTATTVTGGRAKLDNYTLTNTSTAFEITVPNVEFDVTLDDYEFVYDGNAIEPEVTIKVTIGGEEITLEEGVDYEVKYEDNVEPGTGKVIITGKDNYEGIDAEVEFTINKIDRNVSVIMNDYSYGGTLPNPTLSNNTEPGRTVFYVNTVDSTEGAFKWETVTDSTYLDAGTYYMYATIEETAHYNAETTEIVMFKVIEAIAVHPTVENKVYNGKTQIGVYGGEGIIIIGVTEATNVGTYTAHGTLKENYKWADGEGEKDYVWSITPLNIADANIKLDKYEFSYDETAKEPNVIVTLDGKALEKDKDYTVTYEDNVEIGTAKAIITGINNFEGTVIKEFIIKELTLSRIELDSYEFNYTGHEIKPNERIYDTTGILLMRDKDYTLYFVNNVEVGTATIGAVGTGIYRGSVETTFEIVGNILSNAEVTLSGFPFVYDGTEKRPGVTVVFEGNTLANGRDYVLEYNNNVEAGENTACVTIIGIGKYAGSIEKYFTIMKADRTYNILPGKAILLGENGNLTYSYNGEIAETTVTINDPSIASVQDKEYTDNDFIRLTGLKVGKSIIKVVIAATNNYNETVLNTEVTVFENIESAYPIYGTVVINDNDEYTNSPRTLLTLNVDFGDYMYISESNVAPTADNPEWYEFSTKMPYVFDDVEGTKTIYVWFKDKKGNISKMATDSIILDYDADVEFKDNVLLDQTEIDNKAPDVEVYEYHNGLVDMKVIFNQEDVMVDGVRSGVDHATIKYGYKETESAGDYIWQDSNIITGLKYNTAYTFVTIASDRAGNGPTLSEEKLIRTERKYNITITLEDKNVNYNGEVQNIDEAIFALVDDTPVTGTVTYTYYVDAECTIVTTVARDGSKVEGGAPRNPGIYYVKVTLTKDPVYYDAESNVAELRIGWEISKTEDDNVFAYLERVDENSDEYILHITGEGNMADLEELLKDSEDNSKVYWTDYKDKITSLDIGNTSEDNLTNIGTEMFSGLTNITDIVIPDTVISIGDYAFEGCTSVTEVIEIPVSVNEIGSGAFKDVNTPAFEVAFGSTTFGTIDGVLTDVDKKVLVAYPNGKANEKYEIPESITTIKESSFSGTDNLKDVVIPNGVEVIEGKAFYECTNLEIVEIEDLMAEDIILDLDSIGAKAFDKIAKESVIYTFSEEVANMFTAGTTHKAEDTKVYWPPVITLDPIDMNGAIGYKVKFIIDTKSGNPEATKYQWFKVKDDVVTLIPGATSKDYTTDSLTAADDNTYYYCIAYNDDYYYERGYVTSQRAKLTMIENANYMVERGTYNTYLFETLQDAFDFAENDDVIKPLKAISNETDAVLDGNKSIKIDLNTNTINLVGKIEINAGSKVEVIGNGALAKSGDYIFENKGELILNGEFNLMNENGFGIKSLEDSKVTYIAGNITVDSNAIYAENAVVNIEGTNANIIASTINENANAISLHGTTTFNMSAGNVSIGYKAEPTNGSVSGIYIDGVVEGAVRVSGGTIRATGGSKDGYAIVNAGASDVTISGNANIIGSRSGIMTTNNNRFGDIYVQGGTITGGVYGILNNANIAKVVLGTEGKGVDRTSPVIVGERAAIFNAKENDTLEVYDGILYSHGTNVIYEELNNTSLNISATNTDAIFIEEGREEIKTEYDYFLVAEENVSYNGSTYKAVYLQEYKAPTIGVDVKDQTVEVGEKATFEIVISGGIPAVYNYQWQVSRDGGITWSDVTVGTGANTSKYITPITTITMDGYKYRCLVTNGKKDIMSRAATLTVVETVDIGKLRPVVRFDFTNGRVVTTEVIDGKETKVVNMQVIVKSFSELQTLTVNGTNILGQKEYNFTDGSIRLAAYSTNGTDFGPVKIEKEINGVQKVVEYTYTYNMKVLVNGVITVEALDVNGRDNTATQIVDLLFDLKVDYYKTDVSMTNKNVTVVFFANKPVKPIKSIVNSYINTTYLDLVSVDKKEYSYKYTLELDGPLSETIFWFEDEFKNQAYVTVEEILRTEYREIKFNSDTIEINDLTVIDSYNVAQELESVTEVNANEELQPRYGLNSVQSDMFMSRARDLGALNILGKATVAKSYDGVFVHKIEATVGGKDTTYDPVAETTNIYVAAAAKDRVENELSNQNRKYVDIITKDVSLYKGMNISDFVIDDKAPYMYTINNKVSNITSTTIAGAGFRATIIPK